MLSIFEDFRRRCKWFNPANETTGDCFSTLLGRITVILALLFSSGCSAYLGDVFDTDIEVRDAIPLSDGAPDAIMPDTTVPDVATPDARIADIAMPDARIIDAATPDARIIDATTPDAAVLNEDSAEVRVFSYNPYANSDESQVIFQYGNLIRQAINWKMSADGAADDITIHFALYKLDMSIYINTHEGTEGHGKIAGNDFAGLNSQKLIFMLAKAAKAGIRVKLIYHNPTDNDNIEDPDEGIREYLINRFYEDCQVRPHCGDEPNNEGSLEVHRVNWPRGQTWGQHHNKFMLINTYGPEQRNNIYISTANADGHMGFTPQPDYVQSGVLINEHPQLYTAYLNYFDKVWAHSNDIWNIDTYPPDNSEQMYDGFVAAVRDSHSNGTLNYSDNRFSAYFYPLPIEACEANGQRGDAWSITHNPVAKMVERLRAHDAQNRYLKINMYHLKNDNFGAKLHRSLTEIFERRGDHTMDIKAAIKKDSAEGTQANFNAWGLAWNTPTHGKNYNFAFSGEREYYVMHL